MGEVMSEIAFVKWWNYNSLLKLLKISQFLLFPLLFPIGTFDLNKATERFKEEFNATGKLYHINQIVNKDKRQLLSNKAKGQISKRMFQEVHIRGWEMFVFRKIWHALFSWNTRFEIRPFALLPTNWEMFSSSQINHFCNVLINKTLSFHDLFH